MVWIALTLNDHNELNSLNSCKPESVHFVTCPKQGREMEAVVLDRVKFLAHPCPKQGQDLKPSAAPLYPNMGQVPPPRGILQLLFPKVCFTFPLKMKMDVIKL